MSGTQHILIPGQLGLVDGLPAWKEKPIRVIPAVEGEELPKATDADEARHFLVAIRDRAHLWWWSNPYGGSAYYWSLLQAGELYLRVQHWLDEHPAEWQALLERTQQMRVYYWVPRPFEISVDRDCGLDFHTIQEAARAKATCILYSYWDEGCRRPAWMAQEMHGGCQRYKIEVGGPDWDQLEQWMHTGQLLPRQALSLPKLPCLR